MKSCIHPINKTNVNISLGSYLPAYRVDEEDITTNIRLLKKYEWYNEYSKKEKYKQILIHDIKVRKKIGRLNSKRIANPKYETYYKNKIDNFLKNAN